MPPENPSTRRYRLISDLSLFELAPLLGDGATAADLRRLAQTMGRSYALEKLVDGVWKAVGVTAGEDRAASWVITDGTPDQQPPLPMP